MSASNSRLSQGRKAPPPGFGPLPGNQASLLLEKANPGLRRATPDSDALASSDDEVEARPPSSNMPNPSMTKPKRRTSWLTEIPSSQTRKPSVTMSGASHSPSGSHPTTPSVDHGVRIGTNSPGMAGTGGWSHQSPGNPWAGAMWNNEARKEPPSRMQEVIHSPTAVNSPTATFLHEDFQSPPGSRGDNGKTGINFAFPLNPTPKTYRSQSYSVGQLEPDPKTVAAAQGHHAPNASLRGRSSTQYSGLHHRNSRPSVLGELGHDTSILGRVREDESDNEVSAIAGRPEPQHGRQQQSYDSLVAENMKLRQQAIRGRTLSTTSATSSFSNPAGQYHTTPLRGAVPEESDTAIEELEEQNGLSRAYGYSRTGRRFSEQTLGLETMAASSAQQENRSIENGRRAQWQTSLGFGSVPELPQSRRHSFAEVPTRHGSIGSADEHGPASEVQHASGLLGNNAYRGYKEGTFDTSPVEEPGYFTGPNRLAQHMVSPTGAAVAYQHDLSRAYTRNAGTPNQGYRNQPLFIVTFKTNRADVFYIQEDTGLAVHHGDLVIVEADRGTDLGTVAHANISYAQARHYKEEYAEDHYKWLMMFSQQTRNGGPNPVNPNGLPAGGAGSAVGGMGPPGQHPLQEPATSELRPKLIKRLAQPHEIQTLKEKEGNEAKAKRVCQQKVAEHRLNMEILDAEFQLDWKKLTFYYFADAYVNFNTLVTDLFKIYKTRIWMSAINPASFVTPTSSLGTHIPSPFSPGAIGGRNSPEDRRRPFSMASSQFSPTGAGLDSGQLNNTQAGHAAAFSPYETFNYGMPQSRVGMTSFSQNMSSPADPFAAYPAGPYMVDPQQRFPTPQHLVPRAGRAAQSSRDDWTTSFQGMSLGS